MLATYNLENTGTRRHELEQPLRTALAVVTSSAAPRPRRADHPNDSANTGDDMDTGDYETNALVVVRLAIASSSNGSSNGSSDTTQKPAD